MDDDPLIPRMYIVLLSLVLIGASVGAKASAKEVPKIPIPTKMATATPSLTSTPSPSASPVPTSTPTPIPAPTETLTFPDIYASEAVKITANITVKRCLYYKRVALGWLEREDSDYHVLTVDDLSLVLSIMANESACYQSVVSYAGAVGIMQVIPKPYYGNCLYQVPCNIYWGMWILDRSIENSGLELGIALYNCSPEGVANDACGPTGGWHYQEHVLGFWLPLFLEELGVEYDQEKFHSSDEQLLTEDLQ